jgi:protein PhnA
MPLSKLPSAIRFFNSVISNGDPESDSEAARTHSAQSTPRDLQQLQSDLTALRESPAISLEEIGAEANRWFSSQEEAKEWIQSILLAFHSGEEGAGIRVTDFNGTELLEGDSVSVIKDLKVKGGSSDLKRGTLIKKIHLTSDPGLIECKVDGSVLVLKTEFLKKS